MAGLFTGKVALVTGGATGIGRAACQRYAQEGARVAVVDINEAEAAETVRSIEAAGGEAAFIRADMTKSADIAAMVEETVRRFGRLDAAFNNAGTPGGFTDVVSCTEEEWDAVVTLNLKSVWLCMKHEIPAIIASGGGAIVNTASQAAPQPAPHMATYVATKAGVVGLSRSAALDFADKGVRVNVLLPGPTETPMLMRGTVGLDRSLDAFGAGLPMKRIGRAHEQADVAVWLTSSQSSFVTGMAIAADGGRNLI